MKLNFRDWTIVHAALKDLADRQRSEMNWYDEDSDKRKEYAQRLDDTTRVIGELEEAPV